MNILLNPQFQPLLALLKGIRSGLVYGTKVRFPHALVMTFLFREGSFEDKLKVILDATKQHATNLGKFVFLYKAGLLLQKYLRYHSSDQQIWKNDKFDSLFAGFVGGWIVFGDDNGVNQQIVLYLFSRIMIGWIKTLCKYGYLSALGFPPSLVDSSIPKDPNSKQIPLPIFRTFAALCWGSVMYLFVNERESLQSSLRASMVYLYEESEKWKDLLTFLWHNK